jgi:hypothetical protein
MLVTLKPLQHLATTQIFINGDFSMPLSNTDAETSAAEIAPKVRSLQIIHLALMAGVAAYLVFIALQGFRFSEDSNSLPLIPLGFAIMSVVMSFVVPPIVQRAGLAAYRGKSQVAAEALVGPFQTGHIVGMAMLEGAGFLSCIALTGGFGGAPRWFLAVPVALLVLMWIRFPRVASVVEWLSMAREEIAL